MSVRFKPASYRRLRTPVIALYCNSSGWPRAWLRQGSPGVPSAL